MTFKQPRIVDNDPWLGPYAEIIYRRQMKVFEKENELAGDDKSISDFATGYLYFGLHRTDRGWVFREWAPNATRIFLVGVFNGWKESDEYKLNRLENDVWELELREDQIKQ